MTYAEWKVKYENRATYPQIEGIDYDTKQIFLAHYLKVEKGIVNLGSSQQAWSDESVSFTKTKPRDTGRCTDDEILLTLPYDLGYIIQASYRIGD